MVILVAFFGGTSHAGENQDKRKAKAQARMQEQREREERANQERRRDFRAEDELYKEIETQERLLSQLRRKLEYIHTDNLRKYGPEPDSFQERPEYYHQTREIEYKR